VSENWSLMVHGGAKSIRPGREQAHRDGCLAALAVGADVLRAGGSAVDAAVAAVRVLEDNPAFNAGFGSVVNCDGEIELDGAVMDGETLDVGAVAALRGVHSAVEVAHAMLRDAPCLLVGEGAVRYAAERGLRLCEPDFHIAPEPADEACDTVGCVALDRQGHLACATSTGGLHGVRPGRVGDAPLPGCGFAAEDGVGATVLSGDGESIMRLTLAGRVMADMGRMDPHAAAQQAIARMARVGGEAGLLIVDAEGAMAVAHNSANFAFGLAAHDRAPAAFVHVDELKGR
jgi:beta-aspartyl-peptidase (threonine type)